MREGSHGLPTALSPPVTPSTQAIRTHVAASGDLSLPLPTTVACSYPRWLGPWRHPKQQHLAQRPDMVGQRRRHRRRLELPLLGRARPFGQLRLRQGLAQGGMRQAEIVVDVISTYAKVI